MDDAEKKAKHAAVELAQERLWLQETNDYLEKNVSISNEIFDSFSHELRTPIVTIKTYTDMILSGTFGELNLEQKERLLRVKENTELLIDVVMNMIGKMKERK